METSIVIRTKNEEKWIGGVLDMLYKQTYTNFEITVVDSGSTDKTLEIIKKHPVKLVEIKQSEFTYPYALNIGCKASVAEKYFVFLSAHSVPLSENWLEEGLSNFTDDKIMGVYGPMRALADGSMAEKFFLDVLSPLLELFRAKREIIIRPKTGVLGNTHSIIRRDLWEKHNFNEKYELGGEDQEWATYWMKYNYTVIWDKKFAVRHSHSIGLVGLIKQWIHWQTLMNPRAFEKTTFRNW